MDMVFYYYFSSIFILSHYMTNKTSQIIFNKFQHVNQHQTSQLIHQQKPLSTLRSHFSQWIRAMPMEQRFLAVKIYAPETYLSIRSIFTKQQQISNENNKQQKNENVLDIKKGHRKNEKIMLDSLVFVSDGHDFLDHSPERLFDLLISSSQNVSSLTLDELLQKKKNPKQLGYIFEKINNRQKICQQLMDYLRQQIFYRFKQHKTINESIQRNLQQQKRRKKQFSNHWKYLTEQARYKILLLNHKNIHLLYDHLYQQQIFIKINELQKDIEDLLKLQKNQFCNKIFKFKFKKIFQPMMSYYQLIYKIWKKQVQKIKRKKSIKNNRTDRDFSSHNKQQQNKQYVKGNNNKKYKKKRKSNSLQSNQTNQTQHSINEICKKQDKQNEHYFDEIQNEYIKEQYKQKQRTIYCFQKQRDKSSQQKIIKYAESQEELSQIKSQKTKIRYHINTKKQQIGIHQYKKQQILQNKVQIVLKNNPETPSFKQLEILQNNRKIKQEEQLKRKIWRQAKIKQVCNHRIQQELQQLSDKISQEANQFHDRRIIAFQRIQFLLCYYNIQIKLFGSCANGIAIKNSDIDIAIDGSVLNGMEYLPYNQRVRTVLQKLRQLFLTQQWVKQLKVIKTAAIPVIKMTINTQAPFLDPSIGPMYHQLNRTHYSGQINSDITIQTINQSNQSCHLGIISTNAINQWISQITSLHTIIIIMKHFFSKNNLNNTYQGGLNTFSMIVLFVAFIYHQKLQKQQNAAIVLQKILRFYVYQFNQKQTGIDILKRQQNSIYFIKNNSTPIQNTPSKIIIKDKADLQIRDPMNQQRNMTRNCYSFIKIKKLFQNILKECFQKRYNQINKLLEGRQINQQNIQNNNDILKIDIQKFSEKNIFYYIINQQQNHFSHNI